MEKDQKETMTLINMLRKVTEPIYYRFIKVVIKDKSNIQN